MQYRIDPKSGNKLSALGFGCMRFPKNLNQIDMNKTEKLILDAYKNGVNYYDTAYLYGGSEEALGTILHKNNIRKDIFLATKLPLAKCGSYEDFDKLFNTQLERLKTDYIDYYFMHNMSDITTWKNLCTLGIEGWIKEKKESGKIKQVGFSFHGNQSDFFTLLDMYDWDFCQIQYNYININYQAGLLGLQKAHEKGLPVFIMEPLLGGKLATGLPNKASQLFKNSNPSLTPASWALKWLWNQKEVTVVLSGMNEDIQLTENLETANTANIDMLTEDELNVFEGVIDAFRESYKIPCTGCNYCMPCPHNINIPACFASYNMYYTMGKFNGIQSYVLSTGAFSKNMGNFASLCKKCGKCEKHCPQNIPIITSLEEVSKKLEPFWFKPVVSVVKKMRM